MLRRKFILPVAIFAGVFHFFFWLSFASSWMAIGTSILYAIMVYWSYRYLGEKQ